MMTKNTLLALSTVVAILAASSACAYEHSAGAVDKMPEKTVKKAKPNTKVKMVDINGASKTDLKRLPGITDAEADKIIANRPYGTKMWLITDKVLERKTYEGIKGLVEARHPFKTAEENGAYYEKMRKEKAAKAKP